MHSESATHLLTKSSWYIPICALGPPNAVHPSAPKCRAISPYVAGFSPEALPSSGAVSAMLINCQQNRSAWKSMPPALNCDCRLTMDATNWFRKSSPPIQDDMQLYGALYGLLRTLAVCEALRLRPLSGKQNNVHSGRSVPVPHHTQPCLLLMFATRKHMTLPYSIVHVLHV